MEAPGASESAITPAQAVEHLREKHNLEYAEEYLNQLARDGQAPSHKVGRHRMYRRSLLDQWALGEWKPQSATDGQSETDTAPEDTDPHLAVGGGRR